MNIAVSSAALGRHRYHISAKLFDYPFNRPFSRLKEMNYLQRLRRAKWNRKARILTQNNNRIELNEPETTIEKIVPIQREQLWLKRWKEIEARELRKAEQQKKIIPLKKPTIEKIKDFCLLQEWEDNQVHVMPGDVTLEDLDSDRRARIFVLVRHAAFYICAKKTGKSYPQIGLKFNDRDHTSVMHGVNKINDRLSRGQLLMNGKPFNLDRIGEI
jgi:hypothetical protein